MSAYNKIITEQILTGSSLIVKVFFARERSSKEKDEASRRFL
jgi:hypothetical protein